MPIAIEMNPAAEVLRALSTGIVDFNRSKISDLEPVEAEPKSVSMLSQLTMTKS
tara:strand:- start:163 stop:324 length:162 start_codon:yes stop_codon:yes gene_type:complete